MATSDGDFSKLMTRPGAMALALLFALVPAVAAVHLFSAAWTWWRNGEKVLATVTSASTDDASGNTAAQVEYDGMRAQVELNGVHRVGDVVEVFYDPENPDRLNSNSDVVNLVAGGVFLLALSALVPVCLAINYRSRSRIVDKPSGELSAKQL